MSGVLLAYSCALGLLACIPMGERGVLGKPTIALLLVSCRPATHYASSNLILGLLAEFLFGFLLSLPLLITISLAETIASVVDHLRGMHIGQIYDPQMRDHVSPLALGARIWIWCLMIERGALEHLFVVFSISRERCPDWEGMAKALTWIGSTWLTGPIVQVCLWISPLLVLWMLVDWGIISVAKVCPTLSLSADALLIKSVIGVAILWAMKVTADGDTVVWSAMADQMRLLEVVSTVEGVARDE